MIAALVAGGEKKAINGHVLRYSLANNLYLTYDFLSLFERLVPIF